MGKVYKARHLGLDKIVCIKTLKAQLLEDATVVGRFEREAKAASRLNHANSIQVLDFGQDELEQMYIVMEYVSGKDLRRTLMEEFPLGEERICHIMSQVLGALSAAHAQSVIHRDLKPENIMLEQRRGEPDFVKVLDFGIAKIQDPDVPGLTRADVVCGTPLYMSPEQATGSEFDARADLYAIGVILYQLATGHLPFDGGNSMEILMRHVNELPVPPRTRRPEVAISEKMEALILKALSKMPEDRPQSADEFRAEILKIGDMLKRRRQDAETSAQQAALQHRQQREQDIKAKQDAQAASFAASATAGDSAIGLALPKKSKAPLFVTALVVALVVGAGLFFAVRSPSAVGTDEAAPEAVVPVAQAATQEPEQQPDAAPTSAPAETPEPVVTPEPVATPEPAVVPEPLSPPKRVAAVKPAAPPKSAPAAVAPAASKPPALRPGDRGRALELVDEADLLSEEGRHVAAIRLYREAIAADPVYSKAYKGLIRAGTEAGDASAKKAGLVGYLQVSPDAPDASGFRRMLDAMK